MVQETQVDQDRPQPRRVITFTPCPVHLQCCVAWRQAAVAYEQQPSAALGLQQVEGAATCVMPVQSGF